MEGLEGALLENIEYNDDPVIAALEAQAVADVARIRTLDDAVHTIPEPEHAASDPDLQPGAVILDSVLVCSGEVQHGDPVVSVLNSLQDVLKKVDDGEAGEDLFSESEVASASEDEGYDSSFVASDDSDSESHRGSPSAAADRQETRKQPASPNSVCLYIEKILFCI